MKFRLTIPSTIIEKDNCLILEGEPVGCFHSKKTHNCIKCNPPREEPNKICEGCDKENMPNPTPTTKRGNL